MIYLQGRSAKDVSDKTWVHGTREHLRPDTMWADERQHYNIFNIIDMPQSHRVKSIKRSRGTQRERQIIIGNNQK